MRKLFITAALTMALAAMATGTASADSHGAKVTVVHGVPGLTVDVCVDGAVAIPDFAPGTVTDPIPFAAGTYDLGVYGQGSNCADEILAEPGVELTNGLNATFIAHLDEGGTPMLSIFVNDTSAIAAGEGRLTVRHTAEAPAVDIWANGDPLFVDLGNPDEGSGDVPAATYSVAIQANPSASAEDPVVGPIDLQVPEGTHRIVYAVGTLGDTFELLVQDISDLGTAPGGVDSGSGDLAGGSNVTLVLILAAAAVALVAGGGRLVAHRRSE